MTPTIHETITHDGILIELPKGTVSHGNLHRGAVFDHSLRYRYVLWRSWSPTARAVHWICCNPSTATHMEDDRTVNRIITQSRKWGYGSMILTNLFAYRSTDPANLERTNDPVGPDNDFIIEQILNQVNTHVAAWGQVGGQHWRAYDLAVTMDDVLDEIHCLYTTKHGHQHHPLTAGYVPKPQAWNPRLISRIRSRS